MRKINFYFILSIVNVILKGTRFFKIKNFLLNLIGIKVGINTKVVGPLYIGFINNLSIGDECWIGKNFSLDGNGSVHIKNNCDIAPNVVINTGGHEIGNSDRRAGRGLRFSTTIGSGTWIGTNVTIINGANIDNSSIVAAGSTVVKDVEKNTLVAGVPARVKKELAN